MNFEFCYLVDLFVRGVGGLTADGNADIRGHDEYFFFFFVHFASITPSSS